jgi:hypothetical protein
MDLQLTDNTSRPWPGGVRSPRWRSCQALCFSIPHDSKKDGLCFPQVYSPSRLIPSGVDAEKLSGVKFHQSCPYRGAGMGAVKKALLPAGHIYVLDSEISSASATRRGTRRNKRCIHLDVAADANGRSTTAWPENRQRKGTQPSTTLFSPCLPRHRSVQSMGVRARSVAACSHYGCWLKPRSACGT